MYKLSQKLRAIFAFPLRGFSRTRLNLQERHRKPVRLLRDDDAQRPDLPEPLEGAFGASYVESRMEIVEGGEREIDDWVNEYEDPVTEGGVL